MVYLKELNNDYGLNLLISTNSIKGNNMKKTFNFVKIG